MATQTTTADRIRQVMQEQRISQRMVATSLNLSQTAIFRRLNGDVDFSVSELTTVASLLGTPAAEFLPPTTPASDSPQSGAGVSPVRRAS